MEIIKVLGCNLLKKDIEQVPLDRKLLINTISPNSFSIGMKDKGMMDALQNSDLVVLDGLYFGIAPLLLKGKIAQRIAGWDCLVAFSERLNKMNGRVFFLGSTEDTLAKIKGRYHLDYPNVEVATFSPPFKPEFSDDDLKTMHQAINNFKPNVVFVGFTAPKQEKWGYSNKSFIDTNIIIGIGNVFDWYAGTAKRPPKFWRVIGLEWALRMFYRPEIIRRNITNQLMFFWYLFLIILRIRKV